MGTFGTPSSYNNTGALGSATNPTTAQGLSRDRENQKAILELPGTQAWVEKTITDGVIIPTSAEIIVLPEGGASTDSLTTIALTSDGTTTLHGGMLIRLKAANSNTITVVHGTGANNISTIDGNNVVLDTTWYLELKLINGLWVQQETSAYKTANEAKTAANAASTPATTTSRGIARVATLADMEPGVVVGNGPAVLAVGSEALNALVPTFLIGSIISTYAANGYIPNGCVPTDGAEYTASQFPSFYTDYLVAGKIVTCTYTEFAAQVALTGNCGKFALDTVNQKFKAPLLKDGDSITQAANAAELGKSVKAGLPNITGDASRGDDSGDVGFLLASTSLGTSGALKRGSKLCPNAAAAGGVSSYSLAFDASSSNSVYRNDVTTVLDEQVRLRHFVIVANAQNSASVFDWSAYMVALAGKANTDLSNVTVLPQTILKDALSASGSAPVYACRAWVNFYGASTAAIRASGNVSSIIDNGVGNYTVNFTVPFVDANYSVCGTTNSESSSSFQPGTVAIAVLTREGAPQLMTTSQVRIITAYGNAGAGYDFGTVCLNFFR